MINNNKSMGQDSECDRDEIFIKFISATLLIELAFYDHKQSLQMSI